VDLEAETRLLFDITLMLIIAGVCSIVLKKLRLPTIIGYLLAGFLLGPHIFPEVVVQNATVEIFASMGIVLLMFFIGLELNLRGLKKVASYAAIIVTIEMSLMVIIGYSLGLVIGLTTAQALFLGVTISCASTAVVLGVMKENAHMDGKLSKAVTGILILEDIGLIIILAISAPIMGTSSSSDSMLVTLLIIASFIGMTVVIGLAIIPRAMDWVNKHYSGETLFLVAVGIGFGLALISSYLGLSVAIGAFLAGIIISQSVCCDTIIHKVEPMKEMFMAIFFISIGLQLDPTLMLSGLPLAMIIAATFILGKLVSIAIGCLAANFKSRSAFLIGTSMVAMGEFTFVVAKVALDGQVIDGSLYSSVIGAAVITMLMLPFVSKHSPKIFDAVVKRMPKAVFNALDRVENTRLEVRERMGKSKEVSGVVRKQLLYLIIDFVVIVAILLAVNLLTFIKDIAINYSDDLNMVPSLILFILSLILILPAIAHMVKRLRIISETLANTVNDDGPLDNKRKARAYRFFRNIGSTIVFVLLIVLIFPLLPRVDGLPVSPFEILLGIAVVAWLAWDTINAAYDKVSAVFTKSLTESGEEKEKG
jgi:monovalent cation:H+ antiporter-2, CPA2 family